MPKSRNPVIKFDQLQMYFGEPYVIDVPSASGTVTVYQPTIGDIVLMGEDKFYASLNPLITNTTSYRLPLWDAGIDWNTISDFELFVSLYQTIEKEVSELLFKFDISKFQLFEKSIEDTKSIVLYNAETETEIDEIVYFHISQYLRQVFSLDIEEKLTKDATLKDLYIRKDRQQLARDEYNKKRGKEKNNSIRAVISTCVNHPGFKYNLKELREVGVCQFYDSVQRLQIYENSSALLKGMYSGMIDAKGIPADQYNFFRDIREE